MAITRISQSSVKEGLEKFTSFYGGFSGPLGVYEPIATATVGAGGAAAIQFGSAEDPIPQTYQHLQVRMVCTTANDTNSMYYQFNADTASNYVSHGLTGDGATARGRNLAARADALAFGYETGTDTTYPTGLVIDILDYASTSKNKTVRSFAGQDSNGSGEVSIWSGLWMSTSAITSFKIYAQTGDLKQYSTASLFGVRS